MKNEELDFVIIGLTGPIGSGCTTLAKSIETYKPGEIEKRFLNITNKKIIKLSNNMKKTNEENELEKMNIELENLFEQRGYLNVLINLKNPNFKYISMSALIVKLTIESMESSYYKTWQQSNSSLADILEDFRNNYIEEINLFNDYEKKYDKLNKTDLNKIDEMLSNLHSLRNKIRKYELKEFFEGNHNELYMQTFGDNLRGFGNAFVERNKIKKLNLEKVAYEVNKIIKYYRNRVENKTNNFIVDAFRNPNEINFFRERFSQFYLVSIDAKAKTRKNRVKNDISSFINFNKTSFNKLFKKIDNRDWGDGNKVYSLHKQNVSQCYYLSDIAIDNDENENSEKISKKLFNKFLKYLALIVSPGCIQPTKEETYMNLAYSLSLRSSCISRKVGAVITDKDGYVLGLGWNDAARGQIGCGFKQKIDYINHIDDIYSLDIYKDYVSEKKLNNYCDHHSVCFKDVISKDKIRKKVNKLSLSQEKKEEILEIINIKRLEYCRSLHAEENALLQIASKGGVGVEGGVIYTTTFPCELCAKKIYQSGIKDIYYTEPYPNSISENIFLVDGIRKIRQHPFEGVKSFSYFKLYKPNEDKKEMQKLEMYNINLKGNNGV